MKRTKGKTLQKSCFTVSNVEVSCAPAILKRETPTIAIPKGREYFETWRMSNINRQHCSPFRHPESKQLPNIQQIPLFTSSNNPEMADFMNQFGTLYREIKRFPSRLGRGLVNAVVNEEGLVMCSNCYYYTKIGESCWHCGNSC